MRSEAYPTEPSRAAGMASVIMNREIEERYSMEEVHGLYFVVLKAGNHQEIARSCPIPSEAAALLLLPSRRCTVPAAVIAPPPLPLKPVAPLPPMPPYVVRSGPKWFLWFLLLLPLFALLIWALWPIGAKQVKPASAPVALTRSVPPEPAPAKESRREVLRWIFFDFGKADLNPESKVELDKMAHILRENPGMTGVLRGNTDAVSGDDFNNALSRRRAEAAKAYLVTLGIDGSRITIEAVGERQPIAANALQGYDTPEGRQLNRRVELFVKGGDGRSIIVESVAPEVPKDLKPR
jgi:outer membrane protein OmpA-like peptidoglycan-associated protein